MIGALRWWAICECTTGRRLPPDSLFEHEGRTYVDYSCGHCVHLQLGGGKAICGVYEERPEACRAFRAGSFECMKARRAQQARTPT